MLDLSDDPWKQVLFEKKRALGVDEGVLFGFEIWRARQDSNPQPLGPKPSALSIELRTRICGFPHPDRSGWELDMLG